jgi:cytoskeletal protein CcmA (bactofilin family)
MQATHNTPCVIGEGIQIRGTLSGSGDLVVRGRVEGQISLQDHLTVDASGVVVANVSSRSLTISGNISGNVEATEAVVVAAQAVVEGDITTRELQIDEGASLHGRLNMDLDLPDGIL